MSGTDGYQRRVLDTLANHVPSCTHIPVTLLRMITDYMREERVWIMAVECPPPPPSGDDDHDPMSRTPAAATSVTTTATMLLSLHYDTILKLIRAITPASPDDDNHLVTTPFKRSSGSSSNGSGDIKWHLVNRLPRAPFRLGSHAIVTYDAINHRIVAAG
jgi:hypothetical protein